MAVLPQSVVARPVFGLPVVAPDLMSRLQLALDVDALDEAIAFYRALFGTEPADPNPPGSP